jgi:hypothetical protein
MNICTNASGLVVMASERATPTPPAGGTLYQLDDTQGQSYLALAVQPNGGITYISGAFAALPYVAPVPVDYSNMDNCVQAVKAVMAVMAVWTGHTMPQAKAAFATAWNQVGP